MGFNTILCNVVFVLFITGQMSVCKFSTLFLALIRAMVIMNYDRESNHSNYESLPNSHRVK